MEPPNGIRRPNLPITPRPITLGDILRRAEGREMSPPPSAMARVTSPTGRLGALANGRPRRPRTLNRRSPSVGYMEDDFQFHDRGVPFSIPTLARRRYGATDTRVQNFYSLMSRHRQERTMRSQRHGVGRAERLDLFSFGSSRDDTAGYRHGQTWPRFNSYFRSSRTHRASMSRPTRSSFSRMMDMYDSERPYYSNGRARIGRPDTRRNGENGRSRSDMPSPVRRFFDFAAEFIPVTMPSPNAEPPEWSLDVTPADFGPFAIGRSAVSRDRSLAMIAALSQLQDDTNHTRSYFNSD